MSLTTLRRSMLTNVPNIPRFGVTINVDDRRCSTRVVEFEGQKYSVAMLYAIHAECRKRIRALFPREDYNRTRGIADRAKMEPLLIFCPKCGAMAGKHARKQLRVQGRPHSFYNPDGNFTKNFIAANYIFPRGVNTNLEGEITSVSREWARRLDDEEAEAYEIPEYDVDDD